MVLRISGWGGLGELGLGLGSWVRVEQMQAQFPEPRASLSLQHANTTGATLHHEAVMCMTTSKECSERRRRTGEHRKAWILRCEVSSRIGFLW